MNDCYICQRRILRHSKILSCFACSLRAHLNCLPSVGQTDSIYENRQSEKWLCTNCTQNEFPFNHFIDDIEFKDALSEYWFKFSNTFSFGDLERLEFCPFEINDDNSYTSVFETDPDLQYFNNNTALSNVKQCDYYLEGSFNKKVTQKGLCDNQFSMLQLNIRSVPKNLTSFISYLEGFTLQFTIIGLT